MNDHPANSDEIQGRFKPGQSGNPAGKPRGARHRITMLAEQLMADDATAVVQAVIAAAKGGDMVAARLVLDRIAPARKGSAVTLDLPTMSTAADCVAAMSAITSAAASGEITSEEGQALAGLVEMQRKAIETGDLETRIAAMERRLEGKDDAGDVPLINRPAGL